MGRKVLCGNDDNPLIEWRSFEKMMFREKNGVM